MDGLGWDMRRAEPVRAEGRREVVLVVSTVVVVLVVQCVWRSVV